MMSDNGIPNDIRFDNAGISTDATWYWMVTMLVMMAIGPAPKLDTLDDLKKGISEFNDRVQALKPEDVLEVKPDEV